MIINEDIDQAEFVNKGHKASNGNNICVIVTPKDPLGGNWPTEYSFEVCYKQMDINPMDSIAGDDTLKPCIQPILNGTAKVTPAHKVVGRTDNVPARLSDASHMRAIKIGLKLVNHNLTKYDDDIAKQIIKRA